MAMIWDMYIEFWIQPESISKATSNLKKSLEEAGHQIQKQLQEDTKMDLKLDIAYSKAKLEELKLQLKDVKKEFDKDLELEVRMDIDDMQKHIKKSEQALKDLEKTTETSWDKIKKQFISRWFALKTAAVAGIIAVGKRIIELWDQYEQAKISFTTMLGSAEAADKTLKELSDFASKTPFEITGIRENAKQLIAMGVAQKDLIPTLKALWDVSAWLNVPLERLALNYGQVLTQGKLTGKELRDFTTAGVPLLDELARNLNKTKVEIQDMISKGKISSQMMVDAFESMTSAGGKFDSLMEKQSNTLSGSWSNLMDTLAAKMEKIGVQVTPILTKAIQGLNSMLENNAKIINISSKTYWEYQKELSNNQKEQDELIKKIDETKKAQEELIFVYDKSDLSSYENKLASLREEEEALKTKTDEARWSVEDVDKAIQYLRDKDPTFSQETTQQELENVRQKAIDAANALDTYIKQKQAAIDEINKKLENKSKLTEEWSLSLALWWNVSDMWQNDIKQIWILNWEIQQHKEEQKWYNQELESTQKERDKIEKARNKAINWSGSSWWSSTKTNEQVKALEKSVKALDTSYKDVTKKTENYEKAVESHQKNVKKFYDSIQNEVDKVIDKQETLKKKYQETLASIDKSREESKASSIESYYRDQYEKLLESEKEISDMESGNKDYDRDRIYELENEIEALQKSLKEAKTLSSEETIQAIKKDVKDRFDLETEAEKQLYDLKKSMIEADSEYVKKMDEATKEYDEQNAALEMQIKLLDVAKKMEVKNAEDITALKESEVFKNLELEQRTTLLKYAEEKLALTEQNRELLDMKEELAQAELKLILDNNAIALQNIKSLEAEYQALVSKIQTAISWQLKLNSVQSGTGYSGGGFTGVGGKYDIAGVVHKWEYVLSQAMLQRMGNVIPYLETIRRNGFANGGYTGDTNTTHITKTQTNQITVKDGMDLRGFMERAKWKM